MLAAFARSESAGWRHFLYDLRVPGEATARLRRGPRAWAGRVATPVARVLRGWPAQASAVAFTIDRGALGARLRPWLVAEAECVVPDPAWFGDPGSTNAST